MAKKKEEISEGTKKKIDLFKTLNKMDNTVEILESSAYSNIDNWISTGNYILNACLSGDLFKGIPTGRVTTLAGSSGTGKSFLACSICREAQKIGYTPIYLDSEGAIDKDFVGRLGCDTNNFLIKQVNTIKEVTTFVINMCAQIQEQIDAGAETPKIILVLDSLGNLTSDKEREDAMSAHYVADFTKAKDTKALFRVVTQPLSKLQIPFIVVNHVYAAIGSFVAETTMANGCLTTNEMVITSNGNKEISKIKVGDEVLSADNKFHKILKTWNFEKPVYNIQLEENKSINCSETHRFLINKDHPELESSWKTIQELKEGDEIYVLE